MGGIKATSGDLSSGSKLSLKFMSLVKQLPVSFKTVQSCEFTS